jgi:hypothetical protein
MVAWTLVIYVGALLMSICDSCSPAVQNKAYSFQGSFRHTLKESLELAWLRNKTPISTCTADLACYDHSDIKTSTTLIRSSGDGYIEYKLTLKNVTKSDANVWSLNYMGLASLQKPEPLFSCTLNVFELSAPSLANCTNMVEEGEIISCLCTSNNETEVEMELTWYDKKGSAIKNAGNLLSFVATRNSTGYDCRGRTSTGKNAVPVKYQPLIISRPDRLECTINQSTRGMTTNCAVQKVNPSAICEVVIYNVWLNESIGQDEVRYDHQPSIDGTLFNTLCNTTFYKSLLRGVYNVVIIAYPNISGTDDDRRYLKTINISFLYENRPETFGGVDMSLFVLVLIIIIVSIILLSILRKCYSLVRVNRSPVDKSI